MQVVEAVFHQAQPGLPTVLVGANGAGKSRFLLAMGMTAREAQQKVFCISNTVFDRLREIPNSKRISATQGSALPAGLMKSTLKRALNKPDGFRHFQEIGAVLRYCEYLPEIGFKVVPASKSQLYNLRYDLPEKMKAAGIRTRYLEEILWAVDMIHNQHLTEVHWLELEGDIGRVSRSYDLARIIALEVQLKKLDLLQSVDVFLKTWEHEQIPMAHASSGQLAVISTFAFLSISLTKEPAWLLIDEPENSLHPQWQRSYVQRLLQVLHYRNIKLVIATHAPVLVSGAQLGGARINVFQVRNTHAELITGLEDNDREGVEAILWDVFETVTPANHFVSTMLVNELEQVERGEKSAENVSEVVEKFRRASYDGKQRLMLDNVVGLARKVEERRNLFSSGLGSIDEDENAG